MIKVSTADYIKLFANAAKPKKRNKYNNVKVKFDGYTFDSKREYMRYGELKFLELGKEISDLKVHQRFYFPEIPTATGKPSYYEADFTYRDKEHTLVVEDCKGTRTREYLRKKQWMKKFHGIDIKEVF